MIKEIAVVSHHQQGAARMSEIILQKLDCVDVKVVGRLVHDVEIGLGSEHDCQCHPLHLAAGKVLHQCPFINAETCQELLDPEFISKQVVIIQPLCEIPA